MTPVSSESGSLLKAVGMTAASTALAVAWVAATVRRSS